MTGPWAGAPDVIGPCSSEWVFGELTCEAGLAARQTDVDDIAQRLGARVSDADLDRKNGARADERIFGVERTKVFTWLKDSARDRVRPPITQHDTNQRQTDRLLTADDDVGENVKRIVVRAPGDGLRAGDFESIARPVGLQWRAKQIIDSPDRGAIRRVRGQRIAVVMYQLSGKQQGQRRAGAKCAP